ncbi:YrhA family protein [Lentibacillus sp. L22]|uniref:YrhA family protein n=1 Tax=Lentibacillus sp. L22 TaxID=3163028 RepID=UPI003466BA62
MIKELINQLKSEMKSFGEKPPQPADETSLKKVRKWVLNRFEGENFFNEYEEFLKVMNGFDYNGLIIYNSDINDENNGFINANTIWWENEELENYVFFGDSDISWLCYDLKHKRFCELDKPSGDLIEVYTTYEQMLEEAIRNIL